MKTIKWKGRSHWAGENVNVIRREIRVDYPVYYIALATRENLWTKLWKKIKKK
jgi:hypothetical protein